MREKYKEAAFVEIVPDSSQTNKLMLENMKGFSRQAERQQFNALLAHDNPGETSTHTHTYNLGTCVLRGGPWAG